MTVRLICSWIGLSVIAASLAVAAPATPVAPAATHTFHPGKAPKPEFKVGGTSYKIDPASSSAKKIRALPPEHFDPITRRNRVDDFYRDKLKDHFKDRFHEAHWHCGPFRPEFIYWIYGWRAEWRARWAWHHRGLLDKLLWAEWMNDRAFAAEIAALQRAGTPVDADYMPAEYADTPAVSMYVDEYINAVYNPTPFLAVLKLKSLKPDPQSDWIASATSDSLLSNLSAVPGLFVSDPRDIADVQREQKISDADIVDGSHAAAVGKAMDVERVITGSYVADGDKVLFNLRIVNAKTGAIENGVSKTIGRDELLDQMPGLASSLAGMLGYSASGSSSSAPPTSLVTIVPTTPAPGALSLDKRLGTSPTARRTLKAAEPLSGDFTFTPAEGPYNIQDKIVVSSDTKKCVLHFSAGADVSGGMIPGGKTGHVDIVGNADNPVILRHINFDQDNGGSFKAQYAIFDDCSFHKSGAWFDRGGYSSKWEFNNCVIRGGTPFPRITKVDYGIKFNNCTFINATLSEIAVPQPKDKPLDYMTVLGKGWRTMDHCAFDSCTIPSTIFWCASASNYNRCQFSAGPAFESDTSTEIVAFVSNTTGDTPDKILQATPPKRGTLHITFAPQPFDVLSLMSGSGLAP